MAKEKESPEQPVEEKIPPQQSKESGKAERMSERTPNQQNMYISELLRKKHRGRAWMPCGVKTKCSKQSSKGLNQDNKASRSRAQTHSNSTP